MTADGNAGYILFIYITDIKLAASSRPDETKNIQESEGHVFVMQT